MTLSAAAFDSFRAVLKSRSGLSIGPDKLYLLETRLEPILRRDGGDLAALAERLRRDPRSDLAREVTEAMTTNESLFFRDERPFSHVRDTVLPALVASRPRATPVRIWSAAASSGQEAYSLAMILADQRALLDGRAVEIVGTDIAREPLARATAGLFSQFEVQRGLPMRMLVRHFAREPGGWRVHPALRAMVRFAEHNLLDDLRPLGRFDIVFCRNVLIYFDPPTKARVLDAIAGQMAPDGVLYLGGAESALGLTDRLAPLGGECHAYRPR